MAIKKIKPAFVKDYWPAYRRRMIQVTLVVQISAFILLAAVLFLFDVFQSNLPVAILVLAFQIISSLLFSFFLLDVVTRPTKDLLAAITRISGEPTNVTPPNPNNTHYEKTGFKVVLQTLYELASKSTSMPAPNVVTPNAPAGDALLAALDETPTGFAILNHDRAVTFYNRAAPTREDSEGQPQLTLLFNGTDTLQSWLDECDQNAVKAEHIWERIPDRLPDEEGRRFFDVMATYDKGATSETVLTFIDRTTHYEGSEEALEFISFAAHELRGPITVIRGYLDVLEDELGGAIDDDHRELFRRLTVSANRLSGYINNILNTSRYDRRHLNLHLTEVSAANVYSTISDDMELRASSQHRLLSVNIPPDLPAIAADVASLGEVFGNLIDNAIKYTNEGGSINVVGKLNRDMVEVSVQDNGIGMPGSVVSNLFQKFYRSHRSRETVAGSGIGLYISKAIVESHGGTIAVRSEEGRGSTFTVSLPLYSAVADKLTASDNNNSSMIGKGKGWIKNHSMFRS
ncbi:MAG: putative Histidine kinase [Candidatus Saccharibacteria bacterium]|nr:putative Histidine kinase [Candidatus Saccharibacteria bacterium]